MPRLTITALVALTVALGACGSDDKSASTPVSPPAAAEPTTTATAPEAAASSEPVAIAMKEIKFVPQEISAKIGQKIVWTNEDTAPHNVTADAGADFASETVNQGETFEYTPTQAGKIDYVCTIHPGQTGAITVTK